MAYEYIEFYGYIENGIFLSLWNQGLCGLRFFMLRPLLHWHAQFAVTKIDKNLFYTEKFTD